MLITTLQVNCLSPGYVDTDMNQGLRDDDEMLKKTEDMVMLKRVARVEEQAGAVVYFLSDYASCERHAVIGQSGSGSKLKVLDTTATELRVDGGKSAW